MIVFGLVLCGVDIVMLPLAIHVFRSVVTSRSWRTFTLAIMIPVCIFVMVDLVVHQGWIVGVASGFLVAAICLLGSSWRYITTTYVEDRARERFESLDSETQMRMREHARNLPFPLSQKRRVRFLDRWSDHE